MSKTASSLLVVGVKLAGREAKFFDDTAACDMFDMRRSSAGRSIIGPAGDSGADEIEVQGAFPFVE